MRRHNLAVGLIGFAVLLAACGKEGALPKLPGAQAAGDASGEAAMSASADSKMMVANIRYELADGVSTNEKSGKAFDFADTDEAAVTKLAKALGITGSVHTDSYAWTVGSKDGGDSLYVSRNAGVFSMSVSYAGSGSSGCSVEPSAPDAPVTDRPMPADTPTDSASCEPVTTTTIPPDAPSADEAKSVARDVLRDGGVDVGDATVTTESYDGGATQNVRFQHKVDGGVVDGYESYVAVGPKNKVVSASGYLVNPGSVGSYELATLTRAVERLNESYGKATTLEARDDIAVAPAEPAMGAPAIAEDPNQQPTEPTVIKLTSVEVGLMMQTDFDGDLWLVPAYKFGTDQDDGVVSAFAADDKYIEQPPATTTPKPVDGGATEPGGTAPSSAECANFDGAGMSGQVCASPSEAKAGQPVIFRIAASDADRAFSAGPCFDGVTAEYGDDAGGDVRCEACSTSVPEGPGKLGVERSHTYEKPGTYTAKFTIKSGADCASDPKDSTATATLTIKVA